MFHRDFATQDKLFQTACDIGKVLPTKRQASKYRRGYGSAFKALAEAKRKLSESESEIEKIEKKLDLN